MENPGFTPWSVKTTFHLSRYMDIVKEIEQDNTEQNRVLTEKYKTI